MRTLPRSLTSNARYSPDLYVLSMSIRCISSRWASGSASTAITPGLRVLPLRLRLYAS